MAGGSAHCMDARALSLVTASRSWSACMTRSQRGLDQAHLPLHPSHSPTSLRVSIPLYPQLPSTVPCSPMHTSPSLTVCTWYPLPARLSKVSTKLLGRTHSSSHPQPNRHPHSQSRHLITHFPAQPQTFTRCLQGLEVQPRTSTRCHLLLA